MHASDMVAGRSPVMPDVTHVYDSKHGKYYDACCHGTVATSVPLPGTPTPFVVMGTMPTGKK